ncbi:MAG: nitroreductase family deazaflavin-dependent oxidoreductase [Candidatus Limnocylindrales bacterium]
MVEREVDQVGLALAGDGRVALLTTTGRRTGLPRTAAVGFVEEPDGSLLVAATDPATAWARNLDADPACEVEVGGRRFEATADRLGSADHARAVRELILRYGTPSEGLGRGPSYRLEPIGEND